MTPLSSRSTPVVRPSLLPAWLPRPRPLLADGLLAVWVAAMTIATHHAASGRHSVLYAPLVALFALESLPLVWRRRQPVAVLAVILLAVVAVRVLYGGVPISAGLLIALYTVAAYRAPAISVPIGILTAAALVEPLLASSQNNPPRAFFKSAVFGAAWLLGLWMRTRRAYVAELVDRAERLEREREQSVRRATVEEQARIARELHDVIAHNVSVMVVQATAANEIFESHPARAREALRSIEATGRQALTELRRLLGAVRPDRNAAATEPLAPQPGLDRVGELIGGLRAAGLRVELELEGTRRELAPAVDLSAYRIVQEALTNTLRHANASRVRVRVRYGGQAVEIEVADDGVGPADGEPAVAGHGLIGMRERVALFGGELTAGPGATGGFTVRARLPFEGARV